MRLQGRACAVSFSTSPARGSTTTPPERAAPAIPWCSPRISDVGPSVERRRSAHAARAPPRRRSTSSATAAATVRWIAPRRRAAHAERVVEVLDELRIKRACIVGHGIGGGIAQSIAIQSRRRACRISVSSTAWRSIAGRRSKARIARAHAARHALPSAGSADRESFARDLVRGYGDPERANRSIDLYLRPFDGPDGRDALGGAHPRASRPTIRARSARSSPAIAAPTAIVWGQQDRAIPLSVAKRLQQAIPGATLDVIPGARHFTPEEAPRQVADAIERLLRR